MAQVRMVQVTKVFGPVRALRGVTMSLAAGEIVGLLGPNGSGKSTCLSILGTLTTPTTGSVDFSALGRSASEIRSRLGWVGHEAHAYMDLSVRENLRFSADLHGVRDPKRIETTSGRLGMDSYLDRTLRTCSRGQKQRVAIARALLHSPALLLLDEPTTGLDAHGVELLDKIVREEASRGTTVVIVTHDATFSTSVCHRTIRLERGMVANATDVAAPTAS